LAPRGHRDPVVEALQALRGGGRGSSRSPSSPNSAISRALTPRGNSRRSSASCPRSTPVGHRVGRAASPKRATAARAASWSKPPGPIAIPRKSRCTSNSASISYRRRSKTWDGRRRCACASAIDDWSRLCTRDDTIVLIQYQRTVVVPFGILPSSPRPCIFLVVTVAMPPTSRRPRKPLLSCPPLVI
jgi:hypothetical protein